MLSFISQTRKGEKGRQNKTWKIQRVGGGGGEGAAAEQGNKDLAAVMTLAVCATMKLGKATKGQNFKIKSEKKQKACNGHLR